MPEILLRVVDKINSDFYLNCGCTKRGDVIVAQPDGWTWGVEELKNPDWRIVKLTIADPTQNAILMADLSAFLSSEPAVDPLNPSKTLQRRGFFLDLANIAIPAGLQTYLNDATRAAPAFSVVATPTQLTNLVAAIKLQRLPIADPAILGAVSPAIIG